MTEVEDGGRAKARLVVHSNIATATLDLPVDPARTYTWIPVDIAAALGLRRLGVCTLVNGHGRLVTRALAEVDLEIDGERRPATVVLCEAGDEGAIGALTLDAFDLAMDTANGPVRRAGSLVELLA
jgi:predicted aspartyl protease